VFYLNRSGDLRIYLVGQAASAFGSTLTATATSVVAVAGLHASPLQVSLVAASATLPALLFGPMCGVLADRVTRPRRMLLLIDVFCGGVVLACAGAAFTGLLTIGWLCATAFLLGLAQIVLTALYFSHLRSLDDVRDLGAARGRLQSSEMLSKSLAASVAGPLVAALGAGLLFFLDAFSYLISAACLRRLRSPDRRPAVAPTRMGVLREMRAGVSMIRAHLLLAGFMVYAFAANVAGSGSTALRAVFLLDTLRLPVALYTVPTVAATLLGAFGSLLAPRLHARGLTWRRLLLLSLPAGSVSALALPSAGGPVWLVLAGVTAGIALPVFFGAAMNLAFVAVLSDDIGDEFFGRVTTLLITCVTLASTLGALLGGVLGERFGARNGIWLCQALDLLAVAMFLVWARRRRRRLSPSMTTHPTEPTLGVRS
jgi:MFS family permease